MRVKAVNPEVYYSQDAVVRVRRSDIEELAGKADANPRGKVRLCCHKNAQDKVHEMIIVHKEGAYVRPHRHFDKSEAFHVVKGSADVFLFDDNGQVSEVIRLGDYASGDAFYYRIDTAYYHSLLILSDEFIFHEVKPGPFNKADADFALWAPEESDMPARGEFMKKMAQVAAKFKRDR